eukprot:CAMPEP_0180226180 /NCGR_PEP_ID=MMETSP0987-20121128/23259_1 /TAXON_ID=697907 /ORGANISM="non described non described, Strain CCMP2293" /LENGTH=71 /DNA_ID=CAMNT_0022189623 /DNA_START=94 /DNA_END=308 /DNA_ORIENTATION=+
METRQRQASPEGTRGAPKPALPDASDRALLWGTGTNLLSVGRYGKGGASLMMKRPPPGHYGRPMTRAMWWS